MHRIGRHAWLILGMMSLLLVSAGLVQAVRATATDMQKLAAATRNGCANCHVSRDPTADEHDLNTFGNDFLANDRIWNEDLALMDSDADGCLNGVELGDSDGDGQLDGNVNEETGNPGEPGDCGGGALVDEITWGQLKALFDGNN